MYYSLSTPHHFQKDILRDIYLTTGFHFLLPLLLLLAQFHFAGYVSPVHMLGDVFAISRDCSAGDYYPQGLALDFHYEHLARQDSVQFFHRSFRFLLNNPARDNTRKGR